jgi:hypothetical protein
MRPPGAGTSKGGASGPSLEKRQRKRGSANQPGRHCSKSAGRGLGFGSSDCWMQSRGGDSRWERRFAGRFAGNSRDRNAPSRSILTRKRRRPAGAEFAGPIALCGAGQSLANSRRVRSRRAGPVDARYSRPFIRPATVRSKDESTAARLGARRPRRVDVFPRRDHPLITNSPRYAGRSRNTLASSAPAPVNFSASTSMLIKLLVRSCFSRSML